LLNQIIKDLPSLLQLEKDMPHFLMTIFIGIFSFHCLLADSTNPWTFDAGLSIKSIKGVQLSPDNSEALVTVSEMLPGDIKGSTQIRIYKGSCGDKNSFKLFFPENCALKFPSWSPDGQWIAFLVTENNCNQLYISSSSGEKAKALFKADRSVLDFEWSPDGKKIAFVMSDLTETEKALKRTSLIETYQEKKELNRLWLIDPFDANAQPQALTNDDYSIRSIDYIGNNREFDWSPDSQTIVFAYSCPYKISDETHDSSIAIIDISSGLINNWEKFHEFESAPCYSPDGKNIAYIYDGDTHRYCYTRNYAVRSKNGAVNQELSVTHNEGPFLFGPSILGWTADSQFLLVVEPKGTKFQIQKLPIDGSDALSINSGDTYFFLPSLSPDKSIISMVVEGLKDVPEAYFTKVSTFEPQQLSNLNSQLLNYNLPETEIIRWHSRDGLEIEGLLTYPTNYVPGQKYPLLLIAHGGPAGFFHENFIGALFPYPIANFAENGFMVLRPNIRGSTGYGKAFRRANYYDLGGMDFVDLMAGIDSLIDKGMVDPNSLGIMGWSYGGYMSAWAITQTNRFKAASLGAGVYNFISMCGTTDVYGFMSDYLGPLETNTHLYFLRSPLFHVQKISTPCILEHGINDLRVPVSQAYEFYEALKRENKEAILYLYPKMKHNVTDPNMIKERAEKHLKWFQTHLLESSMSSI
jgi:dipeptidyl aminopeptidase/acylaminoacyl peptidase